MPIKQHEGHRSWSAWNVSLWISHDESFYTAAKACLLRAREKRDKSKSLYIRRKRLGKLAATEMLGYLPPRTPDGARYTHLNVAIALDAIDGGLVQAVG